MFGSTAIYPRVVFMLLLYHEESRRQNAVHRYQSVHDTNLRIPTNGNTLRSCAGLFGAARHGPDLPAPRTTRQAGAPAVPLLIFTSFPPYLPKSFFIADYDNDRYAGFGSAGHETRLEFCAAISNARCFNVRRDSIAR